MSIEHSFDEVSFYCDSCSDFIDTGESDFSAAWQKAQSSGWFYLARDKEHECPDCRKVRLERVSKQLSGD